MARPFTITDTKINELVLRIPLFEDIRDIRLLGGGLTNRNYRVDTYKASYVMRVSDSTEGMLGINRHNERTNSARAHTAGVGAAVAFSLAEENVLVIEWIEASTLHAGDIHGNTGLLARMAASLRQLHAGPAFEGDFYFPGIRRKYLQTVSSNNYFIPDRYLEMEQRVMQLEQLLGARPEQRVPCNNDLLAENFMDDGKKIWIIDYEYSGQNEPSFDIGNLASEIFLNEQDLVVLCDAYWQKHLPSKIARAKAWSMIARFGWVLWASIQEAVSSIDFDFRSWGLKKWHSVLADLQGKQYTELIQLLKQDIS